MTEHKTFVNVMYDNVTGGLPSDVTHVKTAKGGMLNVDAKSGIVEAFAAAIGNKDSVNDIIQSGAFTESLRKRKPRVVWGHDWNKPIGKVLEIEEVAPNDPRLPAKMRQAGVGGLYVKVQFNLKSERGRQAFEDVDFFGEDQEWSIGYKTIKNSFDPGQRANLLHEVELYEVSPVLHGANQLTGTISVKDADEKYPFATSQPEDAGEMDLGLLEEKVGRIVAGRNMSKLRQVIELLQSIVDEGNPIVVDVEEKEKTAYVVDFETKSALDYEPNEVLVYGDGDTVAGFVLDVESDSRQKTADILGAVNDLVCCKGYLAQVPHAEDGGTVRFYMPGAANRKTAFAALLDALNTLEFPVHSTIETIRGHGPAESILVSELFTEPDSVG